MVFFKKAWVIFWKDMVIEYRTRERLTTMFMFALVVIIIFIFAFNTGAFPIQKIAPGMMWVAFTFAGMLGMNRSFAPEKDRGSFEGLLLAPMDPGVIYLGKMLANLALIGIIELVTIPLFALFLNMAFLPYLSKLLVIIGLGTIGYTAIGTLFAAMSVNLRMREVMLPILLFPLSSPILIGAVESTTMVFNGSDWSDGELSNWVTLLSMFTIVFLVISLLLFEYIVEE